MIRPSSPSVARTRALLAPLPSAAPIDVDEARTRLSASIAPLVERVSEGTDHPLVITVPVLRQALIDPGHPARAEEPFRWKPAFVRRSLGLAVVEACASGRFRNPAEAVDSIAEEAVAEWRRTGWRAFHWEPWLAGLPFGARAVVLADSLGWATTLWSALDWRTLPSGVQLGGSYDQWVCPGPWTVRLKARPELRVPLIGSGHRRGSRSSPGSSVALVSVSGGTPALGWADELAYLAVVAGLGSGRRRIPSRVMGLWPEAGIHRCIDIDGLSVDRVVERVATTVAAVVESRVPVPVAVG